jgi:hypothetical protein
MGIHQINMEHDLIGTENTLCKSITVQPGIVVNREATDDDDKGEVAIIPCQYMPEQQFATVVLTSDEFLELLTANPFSIVCSSDKTCAEIPAIAQRIPVRDRRKLIRAGWSDPNRTPQYKVETVPLAVFGAKVTPSGGIILNGGSLAVLVDAAGRTASAYDEIEEQTTNLEEREILWQLNIDLSGQFLYALKGFLLHNRDAKKTSRGTTVCVENAVLAVHEQEGTMPKFQSMGEELARTFVLRTLYNDYPIAQSITELMPWSYEGAKSRASEFKGKGRASSINTTLRELSPIIDKTGIKPKELAEVLDFGFRTWYAHSPTAVLDAHQAALPKKKGEAPYKSKYRLHSTLAIKVMILLIVRAHVKAGTNEKKFVAMVNEILNTHFSHHKKSAYHNSQRKKMHMDLFWQEALSFCDPAFFNSGKANTQALMSELTAACDEVCGKLENKKPRRRTAKKKSAA